MITPQEFLKNCKFDYNNRLSIYPMDINWNYDTLENCINNGYLTRKFYKYLYGHTDYFITEAGLKLVKG